MQFRLHGCTCYTKHYNLMQSDQRSNLLLTSKRGTVLQKITANQLLRIFSNFIESEASLPFFQQSLASLFLRQNISTSSHSVNLRCFYCHLIYSCVFFQVLQPEVYKVFSPLQRALQTYPTYLSLFVHPNIRRRSIKPNVTWHSQISSKIQPHCR